MSNELITTEVMEFKKIIDDLRDLRNRLIFEIARMEFNAKGKEECTCTIDTVLNVYKRMVDDIGDLISKYW